VLSFWGGGEEFGVLERLVAGESQFELVALLEDPGEGMKAGSASLIFRPLTRKT